VASCYYLGLRRAEVFDAKLPFLDRDRMSLDVWSKKTNRMRVVRVEPEFLPYLYGYPVQQQGREWLTMPPDAYGQGGYVLREACNKVSSRLRFTWQDMRRNRATLWRKAGHPASAVNQWLGHTEQTATDHYVGNMGT
jgi:integrase